MSDHVIAPQSTVRINAIDKLCRKLFIDKIKTIEFGHLVIKDDLDVFEITGQKNQTLRAEVNIHDMRTYRLLVMRGRRMEFFSNRVSRLAGISPGLPSVASVGNV